MKKVMIMFFLSFLTKVVIAKTISFPIMITGQSEEAIRLVVKNILPDIIDGSYVYKSVSMSKIYLKSNCLTHNEDTIDIKALTIKKSIIYKNKKTEVLFRGYLNAIHKDCR